MTQDEIIEMATTAFEICNHIPNLKIPKEFIEIFAKLVAAKEREACAKACEDYGRAEEMQAIGNDFSAAIRARGEQTWK